MNRKLNFRRDERDKRRCKRMLNLTFNKKMYQFDIKLLFKLLNNKK